MLLSVGRMYIIPGREKEVLPALKTLIEEVSSEPHTLIYLVSTQTGTIYGPPSPANKMPEDVPVVTVPTEATGMPTTVVFVEGYPDEAALGAHLGGPDNPTAYYRFVQAHGDDLVNIERKPVIDAMNLNYQGGFVRAMWNPPTS